jgi:hypothetical protein
VCLWLGEIFGRLSVTTFITVLLSSYFCHLDHCLYCAFNTKLRIKCLWILFAFVSMVTSLVINCLARDVCTVPLLGFDLLFRLVSEISVIVSWMVSGIVVAGILLHLSVVHVEPWDALWLV